MTDKVTQETDTLIHSNLCTTTTLGTPNWRLLLTAGRCSDVILCYKRSKQDVKMVVVLAGGRQLRFDCTSLQHSLLNTNFLCGVQIVVGEVIYLNLEYTIVFYLMKICNIKSQYQSSTALPFILMAPSTLKTREHPRIVSLGAPYNCSHSLFIRRKRNRKINWR